MSAAGKTGVSQAADENAILGMDAEGRPILKGGRCADCGVPHFPKQPVCPECASEQIEDRDMPREGELYSFSVLHVGAKDGQPRAFGYIDLPNGTRVFSRLKGTDHKIGERVVLALDGARGDNAPSFIFVAEEN